MVTASRLVSVLVVLAHFWVAAMPCPPRSGELGSGRVAMSVAEGEALLRLALSDAPGGTRTSGHAAHAQHHEAAVAPVGSVSSAPPCHEPDPVPTVQPAASDGPLVFFLPACPCGCDRRGPVAGASSARVGAGVPPASVQGPPNRLRVFAVDRWTGSAPDVLPALPEPVPRPQLLA